MSLPQKPNIIKHSDLVAESVIGSGGFGEVSLGTHIPTGTKVAIKKLHGMESLPNGKELYEREINTLASLKNRFLLPFVGYTNELPYCIVTKYIPNGSLMNALHNDTKGLDLDGTDLTVIAFGIAKGLEYIHSKNLIHRDLKTENILLDDMKLPVICDFGSARKQAVDKKLTGNVGTCNYSAPELFEAGEYNWSIDVFSFGVILWEMLAKEVPWENLQTAQVIFKVLMQQSRPTIPSDAPKELADLIEACWSQNPDERPTFKRIVTKFEQGYVSFPDCDYAKFRARIAEVTTRTRTKGERGLSDGVYHGLGNMRGRTRSGQFSLPGVKSQSMLVRSVASNEKETAEKIADHLAALGGDDLEKIDEATNFLQEVSVNVTQIKGNNLWKPVMKFLVSTDNNELADRVMKFAMACVKSETLLGYFSEVDNPASVLSPRTLDIFLYVATFKSDVIDSEFVEALFQLLISSMECRVMCIKLLYIIIQSVSDEMADRIMEFFQENISKFAEVEGGDIILMILTNFNSATPEAISAYCNSHIDQNAVTAYKCFFSMNGQPEWFQLKTVLSHVTSENPSLRRESLEFLRRYGGDANDDSFMWILHSLITIAIKYQSDAGVLLLCRFLETERGVVFFRQGVIDMWLGAEGGAAEKLMKLFSVAAMHDPKYGQYLMRHQLTPKFLGHVAACREPESVMAICWFIASIRNMDLNTAAALTQNGVTEILCEFVLDESNSGILDRFLCAINILIPLSYCNAFTGLVGPLLSYVSKEGCHSVICIQTLALLSNYVQTHDSFFEGNCIAVFSRFNDVTKEATPWIRHAFGELKKGSRDKFNFVM